LVVVGLGELAVLKELVGAESEVEAEPGLVIEVRQADVLESLESLRNVVSVSFAGPDQGRVKKSFTHLLVRVGDGLGDGGVIPQGGQPELGDTRDGRVLLSLLDLGDLGSLLLVLVLLVRVGRLALLDFLVGRLELARDDGGTALVQRLVLDEELAIRQYVATAIGRPLAFFSSSRMAIWNSLSILACSTWTPLRPSRRRRTGAGRDWMYPEGAPTRAPSLL
jgi:hypothetical protein